MFLSSLFLMLGLSTGIVSVTDSIKGVTIVADRGIVVSRADTVTIKAAQSTGEVLLQSSALTLSDYGGPASVKNVSLRGLGTAHTNIYIDGVRVTNVQSGQADLGLLSAQQFNRIVVDYAQNSISLETAAPTFSDKNFNATITTDAGSWASYNASAKLEFRLSLGISARISASGLSSKGNYPYGQGKFRSGADISAINTGADIYGALSGGKWQAKAYYSSSDRGTPGAVSWPSEDRQTDQSVFMQGSLDKRLSSLYKLTISAKASQDKICFISQWGNSNYKQKSLQINSVNSFNLNDSWSVSLASGLSSDLLHSTDYEAQRTSAFLSMSSALRLGAFHTDISLEYLGTFDKDALSRNILSPALNLRYKISDRLSAMGFVRRSGRMPTFNELYYAGYGNPNLKPEDAILSDLAIEWNKKSGHFRYKTKYSLFYNLLIDKITSAPTQENPNIWLPYNIGRVEASGIDILGEITYRQRGLENKLSIKYTGQNALDKTEGSQNYNQQISYVCKHNISLSSETSYKRWTAHILWSYKDGRRDSTGEFPSWNTLNIIVSRSFDISKGAEINAYLSCKNLFDCRHELFRDYPMPGRSITGGISIKI